LHVKKNWEKYHKDECDTRDWYWNGSDGREYCHKDGREGKEGSGASRKLLAFDKKICCPGLPNFRVVSVRSALAASRRVNGAKVLVPDLPASCNGSPA
jgi:hypothetical protein